MNLEDSEFEWKDEYNIGVDIIDNAHRQLFRIVSRVINNFSDKDFEKNKMTCVEALKYLKSYTVKHFAEEEEYQLKINHPGYSVHKKIHDNMREVVVPALEKDVVSKNYSKESLENFAGVCAGWLTAHVMIEDRAIAGSVSSKWSKDVGENKENRLNDIVRGYSSSLFLMNAELFSKKYTGHRLGRLFCYNNIVEMPDGEIYSVTSAVEYPMLEVIARRLVKQEAFGLDSVMLPLVSEMMKSFNLEVIMALFNAPPDNKESKAIPHDRFYAQYDSVYPEYSMLWKTNCGYLAFTIKNLIKVEAETVDSL